MSLVQLNQFISYLPSQESPLSCDIIFIQTKDATIIFDVGASEQAVEAINSYKGDRVIILSHFHPDHISNLSKIQYSKLYASKNTLKYVTKGTEQNITPVTSSITISNTPLVQIMELPSSHAKGCLMMICGEYAFVGDGVYSKPVRGKHSYNAQLLQQMIKTLESIDVKYICLDHDKKFILPKPVIIKLYKDIYSRYDGKNPVIDVEDFFNPDGSVKQ